MNNIENLKAQLQSKINQIVSLDLDYQSQIKSKLEQLAMPPWALGKLLDLAVDLATIYKSDKPNISKPCIVVMAGDHGVVAEGVSPYPQEVTNIMISSMLKGGAGINALAKASGSDVMLVNMGVKNPLGDLLLDEKLINKDIAPGTDNMLNGPAMSIEQSYRAILAGIEVANELNSIYDIFGIGEVGIGNTTSASAIISILCQKNVDIVAGKGSGLDDEGVQKKSNIIKQSIETNAIDKDSAIDILQKVGGYEIAGMAGFILGCAANNKMVVIDGLISTSAALIANKLCPLSTQYMQASHKSVEPGHIAALEQLNKKALFDLDLRLGEGTGAAITMNLIKSSSTILSDVFSLEEALNLLSVDVNN